MNNKRAKTVRKFKKILDQDNLFTKKQFKKFCKGQTIPQMKAYCWSLENANT